MTTAHPDDSYIIVIDDDETMRRACQAALRRTGYMVEAYCDGPSGLARLEELGAGLLVVDLKMPGMGGLEVIKRVQEISPDIVSIVITGFATVSTAVEAMKTGAYDFIPKPFTAEELRVIIARGMERQNLALEAKRLRQEKETQTRRFITFVSHQLQSPLGAVQQYLNVLIHQLGDTLPEEPKLWLDRSSHKIDNMLGTIGDWLTISKIEGGQLATDRVSVSWHDPLIEVLDTISPTATEKQIRLVNNLPANLPPVTGDSTAMRMVLCNLMANAVKYNDSGGSITIAGTASEEIVSISVSDDGPGISPEDLPRIFEEFFRGTGDIARHTTGTGMGLPICKKIVEELSGTIEVVSEPGKGTSFTVSLPRVHDAK